MKMKKSQADAMAKAMKAAAKASIKTNVVKGQRMAVADPYIEVTPDYVSWSRFLKGVSFGDWSGAEPEVRLMKALGQDVNTRGGFLVPAQLSNELIPLVKEKAVIRNLPGVQVIQMNGPKLDFNRVNEGPTLTWGAENTTMTEDTTFELGQNTLETKKCMCLYKQSREVIMNANPSIDGMLRNELARELAVEEDRVILVGTGGLQPLGLYYNPRVCNTDLSAVITADDIKEAVYQVGITGFSDVTAWVCHKRTAYDLATLKDANGRYIYTNATQLGGAGLTGSQLTNLHGTPLFQTTKVPVTNVPSSDESLMVGGDWSNFLIGEEGGLRIETSTERYFEVDQVALRLVKRVGFLVKLPETFVVISGIIASS